MLIHARRARLMAYRIVDMQQKGAVRPGDAASYRIAVTRLDQESADVLIDIVGAAELTTDEQVRFRNEVEEHWRYSLSATVASGSTEVQRILSARTLLGA
jgi:alkylation response protein AidB-like acyl-CoA dehydrogenase